jgi:hypothetical protein
VLYNRKRAKTLLLLIKLKDVKNNETKKLMSVQLLLPKFNDGNSGVGTMLFRAWRKRHVV